jgi:hypothetical protein
MRTADDTQELPLATYEHFADRDALRRTWQKPFEPRSR